MSDIVNKLRPGDNIIYNKNNDKQQVKLGRFNPMGLKGLTVSNESINKVVMEENYNIIEFDPQHNYLANKTALLVDGLIPYGNNNLTGHYDCSNELKSYLETNRKFERSLLKNLVVCKPKQEFRAVSNLYQIYDMVSK